MVYAVQHRTLYRYGSPVDLGVHLLHLEPRDLSFQRVLRASLTPAPIPGRVQAGVDAFGNRVSWMFLDEPHPEFEVRLDALVEVATRTPPAPEDTPPWREVAAAAFAGGADGYEAAEFLFDGPMVGTSPDVTAYVAGSFRSNEPLLAGLIDLNARMRKDFTFRAGATTVNTPVRTVLTQRAGVCQDFAHLVIAGLRGLGLPARYVSGYVRTRPAPGQPRRRGADQSHAWVGCWMGAGLGWIDIDPTNNLVVNDEHVVLGWGRDFSDVSPLRGVILGGGSHTVEVGVDLEPADAADIASARAATVD